MTDPRVEARRAAERLIETPGGPQALLQLEKLFEALERARTANSDEGRRLVHDEVLTREAQLEAATGFQQFETRRIVSTGAAGQPAHRPPATGKGVEAIFRRNGNPTEQRYAVTRVLFDRLGRKVGPEAMRLILADMGYNIAAEDLPGHVPQASGC